MEQNEKITPTECFKQCCRFHWQGIVTFATPLILLPILIYGYVVESLEYRCLYLYLIMTIFWASKCLPLYVSSLIPVFLTPLLGILRSNIVCSLYFNKVVVMFLGAMLVAVAVDYSNLHKRIALIFLLCIGSSPRRLHFGLILTSSLLSMWISNGATAALMCPIVEALLNEVDSQQAYDVYMIRENEEGEGNEKDEPRQLSMISMALYFGVAFGATIGGCAMIVGTATSLTFKGIYETRFPKIKESVNFSNFMFYSFPLVFLVNLLLMFFSLQITHMGLFRPNSYVGQQVRRGWQRKDDMKPFIQKLYKELGPWTCHQIQIVIVSISMMVLSFFCKPDFMVGWADAINDRAISAYVPIVLATILLFALPTKYTFIKYCCGRPPYPAHTMDACLSSVFSHKYAPWGFLFVMGAGAALAQASIVSGMGKMLGDSLGFFTAMPPQVMVGIFILISLFVTAFSQNMASCNILLPIVSEIAVSANMHPLLVTFPITLTMSMAFLFPISTPPNDIVCTYANIKAKYMAIAGILPTILAFCLLLLNTFTWGTYIYPTSILPYSDEAHK